MPPNYVVQADVVDIRQDTPKPTDAFLVDTMVWHWLTYPKATPQPYQIQFYPPYLHQARRQPATLYYCGLSLAELGHQIEKSEREIFQKASGIQLGTKEYRHNYPAQRSQVATVVRTAWGIVKSLAVPLDAVVDDPTTDAALVRFQTQLLDGYDLLILEAMDKAGIHQVLTDDGDYCTVPGIQVFTANTNVISAARARGKLLAR